MAHEASRRKMVEGQLIARGITDERVIAAFLDVPREAFVPAELAARAAEDGPLPIGEGQTISQPYIVALTMQALRLRGTERVLEIGTGSGYAAALLSRCAREVFSVERLEPLASSARDTLRRLGFDSVDVLCADGTRGWPEHAPYDAIAVAAAAPRLPLALLDQLAEDGRLVVPLGATQDAQVLVRVTREGDRFVEERLADVRFVPLIGEHGWPAFTD